MSVHLPRIVGPGDSALVVRASLTETILHWRRGHGWRRDRIAIPSAPLSVVVDGRPIGRGTSDPNGHVEIFVMRRHLQRRGLHRVVVRGPGRCQARGGVLRVVTRPELLLSSSRREIRPGSRLCVTGRVRDEFGAVAGARVALATERVVLGRMTTDGRGRFSWCGRVFGTGRTPIRARLEAGPGWEEVVSKPVWVHFVVPGQSTLPWLIGTGLILLGLLSVMAIGSGRSVGRFLRTRIRHAERGPREGPGLLVRLGRRSHVVSGRILAPPFVRPILTLEGDGPERLPVPVGEDGRFGPLRLASGHWILRAGADGCVETARRLEIPHRGEGLRMILRVLSYEEIAAAHYWETLRCLGLATEGALDGQTPREFLAGRLAADDENLESLTEWLYRVLYAKRPLARPDRLRIEELARRRPEADRVKPP